MAGGGWRVAGTLHIVTRLAHRPFEQSGQRRRIAKRAGLIGAQPVLPVEGMPADIIAGVNNQLFKENPLRATVSSRKGCNILIS
ncbi:hypothetical protein SODG_003544 [Sodalis praecaptivus]